MKLRDGRHPAAARNIRPRRIRAAIAKTKFIVVEGIAAGRPAPAAGQVPNMSSCMNRGGVLFGPLPVLLGAEMRIQRLPETLFTQSPALCDGGEFFKRGLRVRCLVKPFVSLLARWQTHCLCNC